ncbi:Ras and Rab interactor 1 [Merluccius polli]|uniref:Ras and Rab interactor 1 n=1 Tax=Merluccius polli TaxID=89951 RepID=A0AA47N8J8_MERPO|nr:Ras and Rab interactor 1 [Merluccius polli]
MAQEDPLYDFPEPAAAPCGVRRDQRAQGSLRSVSVLDRLLLTLPVWLQLSINPATALHILQREPPGAFLVRNSRTSRRNVLCVRLTDDSVPSFVQQFGIREQHSTFCLESSAISFPDLPRLIAFYCVSRDVLPFPLELPEAIAKATSHKQVESISHMGIEFWSSQLNYRGPRGTPRAQDHKTKESGATDKSSPAPASQAPSTAAPDSLPQPHPASQLREPPPSDGAASQFKTSPTVFQKFCPITTRSPRELDCGLGMGALCFVNPLFIQSQGVLHRRHHFKRSVKVRVSTETTSSLSPPLAPPPPPPLMPKTRRKCKAKLGTRTVAQDPQRPPQCPTSAEPGEHSVNSATQSQGDQVPPQDALMEAQPGAPGPSGQEEDQTEDRAPVEAEPIPAGPEATDSEDDEATVESLQDESDYMKPSQMVNMKRQASPTVLPHLSPVPSPRESISPFLKVSPSLSPHNSTSVSPSLSPYQSPSPSPKLFSLSPFASPTAEDPYHVPCSTPLRPGQNVAEGDQELGDCEGKEVEDDETSKDEGEEEVGLHLEQLYLNDDPECCVSLSSSEGEEAESPSPSPLPQLGVCPLASSSDLL